MPYGKAKILGNFYLKGCDFDLKTCQIHGGVLPEITRFSIYDSKEKIKEKLNLSYN
ncbi:MAG: hypothetical protein PF542_04380 [Nanoarchaeota archaeon]|nr:hypothetical protein [Nanoarchaeota archaeon]